LDNDRSRDFAAAIREKYDYADDAPVPAVTANSYTAVYFLKEALESLNSYDSDAIVDALRATQLENTVFQDEPIYFDEKNQVLVTKMYRTEIQDGGKYVVQEDWGAIEDPTVCEYSSLEL